MSSTSRVGRKYLFACCLFTFLLAAAPSSYSAEPSGEQMVQESSSMYGQAVAHAEDALHAVRDKDLKKAVTHAEMAIKVAQRAQKDFETMKVEQEAQHDFAEGVKSLENALNLATQGKGQLTEEVIVKTLVYWDRVGSLNKGCHGDGCPLLGTGCCAQPGLKCNRFAPLKKCTNYGSPCVCYCM